MSVTECTTADEVWQAAHRVRTFRKSLRPPSWQDQNKFAALVRSAYPAEYPKPLPFDVLVAAAYPQFYPGPTQHTCRGVLAAVSHKFGIPIAELLSSRRTAPLVHARQIGWALSRRLTTFSFPEIGRVWQKDSSSIQYGCWKVKPIIDRLGEIIPEGANTSYWVARAYEIADDFPDLYPFAKNGSSLASVRNLRWNR